MNCNHLAYLRAELLSLQPMFLSSCFSCLKGKWASEAGSLKQMFREEVRSPLTVFLRWRTLSAVQLWLQMILSSSCCLHTGNQDILLSGTIYYKTMPHETEPSYQGPIMELFFFQVHTQCTHYSAVCITVDIFIFFHFYLLVFGTNVDFI